MTTKPDGRKNYTIRRNLEEQNKRIRSSKEIEKRE